MALVKGTNLMSRNKMTTCKACDYEIAKGKKVICPKCGKVNKKPIYQRTWFIIIAVLFSVSLIGSALGGEDTNNVVNNDPPVNEPVENVDNDEVVVDTETASQKNAVKQAQNYLRLLSFSRQGLIAQLEFEKYTTEDATYAVDKLKIDWNEQAVSKAEDYLRTMAFSKVGLKSQLEFEGFSSAEANHGVENIEVDWMEQAAKKAKDYLKTMPFSRARLIDQLEFEGFTNEEAIHGANEAGL
jgi:hypothetical protein